MFATTMLKKKSAATIELVKIFVDLSVVDWAGCCRNLLVRRITTLICLVVGYPVKSASCVNTDGMTE